MIGDYTVDVLQAGLRGLSLRREATQDAIANMETPGYTARRVSFEDQLASATEAGDSPFAVKPDVSFSSDAAGVNGNNVQPDQELMSLSDTELRQQLLVNAVNSKFRLYRTVIGEGA